jgi:hypothetical protein
LGCSLAGLGRLGIGTIVDDVAVSPDRQTLANAGDDASVMLWNAARKRGDRNPPRTLPLMGGRAGATQGSGLAADRRTFPSIQNWLLRDRDQILGDTFREQVRKQVKDRQIQEVVSAPRSPWQGACVERVIGCIRRKPGPLVRPQRLHNVDPCRAQSGKNRCSERRNQQ